MTVKKPQDHKQKNGVVTVKGVTVTIDPSVLDDWDVVECIADIQDEGRTAAEKLPSTVRLMRLLLGGDYARAKKELREAHDGQLTNEVMGGFITEVFEALNPNS